jgi:hypothetical protein
VTDSGEWTHHSKGIDQQKRGTAFSSEEKLIKGKKRMAVYALDLVEES